MTYHTHGRKFPSHCRQLRVLDNEGADCVGAWTSRRRSMAKAQYDFFAMPEILHAGEIHDDGQAFVSLQLEACLWGRLRNLARCIMCCSTGEIKLFKFQIWKCRIPTCAIQFLVPIGRERTRERQQGKALKIWRVNESRI
jgi:hypothetical protein